MAVRLVNVKAEIAYGCMSCGINSETGRNRQVSFQIGTTFGAKDGPFSTLITASAQPQMLPEGFEQ